VPVIDGQQDTGDPISPGDGDSLKPGDSLSDGDGDAYQPERPVGEECGVFGVWAPDEDVA